MSSEIKVSSVKAKDGTAGISIADSTGNVSLSGSLSAGTIGGNVVFPSGHIVQSVFNPTITNTSTAQITSTASTGVADVIGQITITSGNGVLIYVLCDLAIIHSGNAYGRLEICEGTVASKGTLLKSNRFGLAFGTGSVNANFSMWAYDSSPADTTPDYVVAVGKDSSSTTSAGLNTDASDRFSIFLFEVKQ